jgi:hypothetical protein
MAGLRIAGGQKNSKPSARQLSHHLEADAFISARYQRDFLVFHG